MHMPDNWSTVYLNKTELTPYARSAQRQKQNMTVECILYVVHEIFTVWNFHWFQIAMVISLHEMFIDWALFLYISIIKSFSQHEIVIDWLWLWKFHAVNNFMMYSIMYQICYFNMAMSIDVNIGYKNASYWLILTVSRPTLYMHNHFK